MEQQPSPWPPTDASVPYYPNIDITPKPITVVDSLFALAMLVCGFLYWNLTIHTDIPSAGMTLLAVIIFTVTFIYLKKSGYKQNAKSLATLALAAFSAVQFSLFDNIIIAFLNFVFLSALFVYWVCLTTGRQIESRLSLSFIGDVFQQGIIVPFRNFDVFPTALSDALKKQNAKGAFLALTGIIIALPALLAVITLLMSADLAFENFVNTTLNRFNVDSILSYFWQFIMGIPVALYLFGLIYGDAKKRHADSVTIQSLQNAAQRVSLTPRAVIYSALTAFNIIYLVFFVIQGIYLFSAFTGNLPEAFTYAEYARRGFFELCAIAGINLIVLMVSHLLIKRDYDEEPALLRMQTIAISLSTLLLIVIGLSKMTLYIQAYGLTSLRVYTSWFMVLLFLVFSTVMIRQLKRFNASRIIIMGFVALFMVLSYGNVDGVIARYNIAQHEKGALRTLDIEELGHLSDAAVPALYEAYQQLDESNIDNPDLEKRFVFAILGYSPGRLTIMMMRYSPDDDNYNHETHTPTRSKRGFIDFNYQRHRADEIRELLRNEYDQ
jgi:hypothetical protein